MPLPKLQITPINSGRGCGDWTHTGTGTYYHRAHGEKFYWLHRWIEV